uniref:Uncharacterized protein n=1 Tax=Anopheles atroparvus TaxID=41427 RepID=A0AAG5D4L3_ANOAO
MKCKSDKAQRTANQHGAETARYWIDQGSVLVWSDCESIRFRYRRLSSELHQCPGKCSYKTHEYWNPSSVRRRACFMI